MKTKKLKVEKLSKDQLIESMFGIPVGTPDSWFEDQLKIRENKWKSFDEMRKQYNLGSGDIWRERNGQMTNDYYDEQDKTLRKINGWMSDARDYFEYINEKWVWKIDGQKNYNELVELNKQYKS